MYGKKSIPLSGILKRLEKKGYNGDMIQWMADELINYICERLTDGSRLELRRFGIFGVRVRRAMLASHPKTGKKMHLEERRVPYFRPGSVLLDAVRSRLKKGINHD